MHIISRLYSFPLHTNGVNYYQAYVYIVHIWTMSHLCYLPMILKQYSHISIIPVVMQSGFIWHPGRYFGNKHVTIYDICLFKIYGFITWIVSLPFATTSWAKATKPNEKTSCHNFVCTSIEKNVIFIVDYCFPIAGNPMIIRQYHLHSKSKTSKYDHMGAIAVFGAMVCDHIPQKG